MTVKWMGLSVALLASVAISGCLWEGVPDPHEAVEAHVLLFHDITYEWNQTRNELSGHFILSNTHKEEDAMIRVLVMYADFHLKDYEHGYDTWQLGYDDYQRVIIKPGKSMVFNYTFPEQSRFKNNSIDWTPNHISLGLQSRYYYHDLSEVSNENHMGWESINSDYKNDCLDIVDGILVHQTTGRCNPWEPGSFSGFNHQIGRLWLPPPEVWPTWSDDSPIPLSDYPYLQKHVEFLRDFDLEAANVVYFEGEID